jgi:hypothetical protein
MGNNIARATSLYVCAHFIYDADSRAWKTFFYEILEFKLQDYTWVYRTIINGLIEALEKTTYARRAPKFLCSINEKAKRRL